jgi:hypothetical protein
MQIKTTMRYHFMSTRDGDYKNKNTNLKQNQCWQGPGEMGTLCPLGGILKWCNCYEKQYGYLPKTI